MVSGADLIRFGEQNGFAIPPYRDYDEWAALVNSRSGMCPCNSERMCPCIESIEEIANAPTDDVACCTCRFYCNERYINHWKSNWVKQGIIKESDETINERPKSTAKQQTPKREIKNEEIKGIMKTLEKARAKIKNDDPSAASDILMSEIENGHCEACGKTLDAEAHRALFLTKIHEIDEQAYEIDAARAMERLDEIILLYEKVDESLDIDEIPPRDENNPKTTHRDDYHRCLSDVMKHPMMKAEVTASKDRFKVANIFCTGKADTLTKAIELFKGD